MNQSVGLSVHNGSASINGTLTENGLAAKLFGMRWSVGILALCLFGTLLNTSVICVLVRQKYHRTGSGLLIVNLVVIYFVLSFVIYPLNAVLVLLKSQDVPVYQASCNAAS